MTKLIIPFLFIACLFVVSCDSDNDPEIFPIRFGQTDYTILVGVRSPVSFVDGGGVYELTASNPDVLGKFYIDEDTQTLIVIPTAKGESTLTVTDVKTNTPVTLKFTVEDFYLSFMVMEINGDNTNPYLKERNEIRFIRDEENTKQIKIMYQNNLTYEMKCIATGYFDIERSATNIFTLNMMLHSHNDEEFEGFSYTLGGDGEYLSLFNKYFEYGWDNSIASRSLPMKQVTMIMTDSFNNCKISCALQPF
ncbi:hypothetical protein [uncultured Prevotella sp.]|uniref:hypothetical protein n=1 Tax=uncultured Prevotella sp. TaxID=159272 RepID=UPI0027DDC21D|nr:hypothetical protein [uncultured Prevotella sp.]